MRDSICVAENAGVVRRDDQCPAARSARPPEQLDHLGARFMIEITRGFITQYQPRAPCEGARDGDPLLLTAAELRRSGVQALAKTYNLEHVPRILKGKPTRRPANEQRHGDIFLRAQRWQEVESLEYEPERFAAEAGALAATHVLRIAPHDSAVAGVTFEHCSDDGQQCRLAATRWADKQQQLTVENVQVDASKRGNRRRA
jgi:hypothetical protein